MIYPNQYPQYPQFNAPQQGRIWVQGEAGARSYLVAPNSSVDLWDSETNTIYVKSANASGMPSMQILEYKQRGEQATQEYVTLADFNLLKNELNELKAELKNRRPNKNRGGKADL